LKITAALQFAKNLCGLYVAASVAGGPAPMVDIDCVAPFDDFFVEKIKIFVDLQFLNRNFT